MSPRKSMSSADNATKLEQRRETSNPDENYKILIEQGVADKLSPKSTGKIYFQFARQTEEKRNYLQMSETDGGGLHTREMIPLEKIITTLSGQAGHPFKSSVLKECMVGKSSNNSSFLAAILRASDIRLIKPSENSTFLHVLVDDFDKRSTALLKRSS
ncbi:hypothetical protein [Neptuniibacter sp.]|uniref:hypothetical protein n=1 Tax=Neptuniibacter sp. TaxID=1962643 RepID=UPI00260282F2|nr:hypothetical protein [Neptuniibacter sp.]MCP4595422.1 hypothetical protein [Neptuniibacter sp.]